MSLLRHIDHLQKCAATNRNNIERMRAALDENSGFFSYECCSMLSRSLFTLRQQEDSIFSKPLRLRAFLLDYFPEHASWVKRFLHISYEEEIISLCAQERSFQLRRLCTRLSEFYKTRFLEDIINIWLLAFGHIPWFGTHTFRKAKIRTSLRCMSFPFVEISAGDFWMGAQKGDTRAHACEYPSHHVTLSRGLLMGVYPVTQDLYQKVMGFNPSSFVHLRHPVERVSWYDALRFCNRLSRLEGLEPVYVLPEFADGRGLVNTKDDALGYRLPTEAEWEYTAKAGGQTQSIPINDEGWHYGNSMRSTQEVGAKQPNSWGIYDMKGNVWEWVFDGYTSYCTTPAINPRREASIRVFRGGSWLSESSELRDTDRCFDVPTTKRNFLGFRICRTMG